MKKWISLCLALTLAGNTALFAAEEVKQEVPRSSLAYAQPIAKIAFGIGGAIAAILVANFARRMKDPYSYLFKYKNWFDFYKNAPDPRGVMKGAAMLTDLFPVIVSGYVALQGVQELKQQLRTPKKQEMEVTQEEPLLN